MISREFRIEVSGNDDLLDKLVKGGRNAVELSGRFLYKHASEVFMQSQYEVPVDTGALRSSGYVTTPYIVGKDVGVAIVYGGAAAPYALWVHEILENYHEPPTKAKFLEDPLTNSVEKFREGFRRVLDDAIEGRFK
jgi:hypothetical protein